MKPRARIFHALHIRAALPAVCVFVAGCISNPSVPPGPVARQAVGTFSLAARLSGGDGEQSASGRLEWRRVPGFDRWTLLSPLGQIVARLVAGPEGAELMFSNGERRYAAQTTDLLPELFPGLADLGLPPSRLAGWVQAAPSPDAEVRALDMIGRPARIIDEGWIVDYLDYRDASPEALPRLINISRGKFRLRLSIDQWETETP
ncbi:MAG: outer membrane lipoprotein LolB [Azoarcus sp.]|nr:outer membrane lipoprotein LolB [Azoarcus sp.]